MFAAEAVSLYKYSLMTNAQLWQTHPDYDGTTEELLIYAETPDRGVYLRITQSGYWETGTFAADPVEDDRKPTRSGQAESLLGAVEVLSGLMPFLKKLVLGQE